MLIVTALPKPQFSSELYGKEGDVRLLLAELWYHVVCWAGTSCITVDHNLNYPVMCLNICLLLRVVLITVQVFAGCSLSGPLMSYALYIVHTVLAFCHIHSVDVLVTIRNKFLLLLVSVTITAEEFCFLYLSCVLFLKTRIWIKLPYIWYCTEF